MSQYQIEYAKCFKDKTREYFMRTYLSTFDASMGTKMAFNVFPRQYELLKSIVKYPNTIAIKHRQAGITTVTSGWVAGQFVFCDPKKPETVLCIGNKLDISEQLVEKIADFLDQVPRWFWGNEYYSPDPDSEKNTKSIYKMRNKQRFELFNGCKVYARSSGENAARGISAVSILIFDEAAFIQNGVAVYSQAVAATASVKDAKIIMISTPNGKDQLYYKTYSKSLKKENNYNAVEFKWFQDPRYNRFLSWIKKDKDTGEVSVIHETVLDDLGNIEYNEEKWRELEREGWKPSSPWYVNICDSLNNDPQKIAQEIEVSFVGSSNNVIPVETIDYHMKRNVVLLPENWKLKDPLTDDTWIWKEPIKGHRYILSCDNSSGSGDDRTSIQIVDLDAIDENGTPYFDQVLEYNGKKTGDEIGEMVNLYGRTYNNALVVVEDIGGYGSATILQLLSLKYPNMYYDDPTLKTYTVQRNKVVYNGNDSDKLPGFHTSNVRYQMISNFVSLLKSNTLRIRSMRVITEMETWIYKNGRPDHMDGCHDDSLMSLSMGMFVAIYYMMKNEQIKKMDSAIMSSWMVNKSTTPKNEVLEGETVRLYNTYPKPFFTTRQMADDKRKKFVAMMMLTGIAKTNKKQ